MQEIKREQAAWKEIETVRKCGPCHITSLSCLCKFKEKYRREFQIGQTESDWRYESNKANWNRPPLYFTICAMSKAQTSLPLTLHLCVSLQLTLIRTSLLQHWNSIRTKVSVILPRTMRISRPIISSITVQMEWKDELTTCNIFSVEQNIHFLKNEREVPKKNFLIRKLCWNSNFRAAHKRNSLGVWTSDALRTTDDAAQFFAMAEFSVRVCVETMKRRNKRKYYRARNIENLTRICRVMVDAKMNRSLRQRVWDTEMENQQKCPFLETLAKTRSFRYNVKGSCIPMGDVVLQLQNSWERETLDEKIGSPICISKKLSIKRYRRHPASSL